MTAHVNRELKDKLHGGRVNYRFKQFLVKAAEQDGRILASFVRQACKEKAEKVLEERYSGYKGSIGHKYKG